MEQRSVTFSPDSANRTSKASSTLAASTLHEEFGGDALRAAKKHERLINHVRSQVVKHAAARRSALTPELPDLSWGRKRS